MADWYPLYSTVDLITGPSDVALTIMYRGKRFHIHTSSNLLASDNPESEPSNLHTQLQHFLQNLDDEPEAMEQLEEWMIQPCLSIICEEAPKIQEAERRSLQQYFSPATIRLVLSNAAGSLIAAKHPVDKSLLQYLTPNVPYSTISPALEQGFQCLSASDLIINRELSENIDEEEENSIPTLVKDDAGRQYYFKAALDRSSFTRELDALLRIHHEDPHHQLKVSRLAAPVQLQDDGPILGLLLHVIHHRGTVSANLHNGAAPNSLHQKWAAQIEETVKKLHKIGIVWGDVKPDNVLVNAEDDAVVIDFGGGFAPKWVDQALENTKDGDDQGVSRIKNNLEGSC